ncbi:hypothetical protein [Amycolatopsis endophytica]|uniref:hypothetical protein n=1 Tax=Amycolatopsis endophytica TaxID=860233 RepID=UPI0015CA4151|nr:hypothetical protein [Amycolatopsis endophytica]
MIAVMVGGLAPCAGPAAALLASSEMLWRWIPNKDAKPYPRDSSDDERNRHTDPPGNNARDGEYHGGRSVGSLAPVRPVEAKYAFTGTERPRKVTVSSMGGSKTATFVE